MLRTCARRNGRRTNGSPMKIFAVYARVVLTKKPEWLDAFREEFDEPFEPHITCVQPRFIDEDRCVELRQTADQFFQTGTRPIHFYFDEIVSGPDADGVTIMIGSRNVPALVSFQKSLVAKLAKYGPYTKPEYEGYEKNFWPHLTIGRKLSADQTQRAYEFLKNEAVCEGRIEEIVLTIVNEQTVEEARNPVHKSTFTLAANA